MATENNENRDITMEDLNGVQKLLDHIFDTVVQTDAPNAEADTRILNFAMSVYDDADDPATKANVAAVLEDPALRDAFIQGAISALGALQETAGLMQAIIVAGRIGAVPG